MCTDSPRRADGRCKRLVIRHLVFNGRDTRGLDRSAHFAIWPALNSLPPPLVLVANIPIASRAGAEQSKPAERRNSVHRHPVPTPLRRTRTSTRDVAIMGWKEWVKQRSLRAKDDKRTNAAELTLRESIYPICLVTILFFLWGFSYGLLDTLNKYVWPNLTFTSIIYYVSVPLVSSNPGPSRRRARDGRISGFCP